MVDLKGQYLKIKSEIDHAIMQVLHSTQFINGDEVHQFAQNLQQFLNVKHVVPCANGTDALQLAIMALNLPPASEIVVPTFNYIAAAEAIALTGHTPVFAEADYDSYNMDVSALESLISPKTKAIVAVHLFGQCVNMDVVLKIAQKHQLYIIEDNAQSLGSECIVNGQKMMAGTIGHVGTTSFFPSKNLGCYGDGGAVFTNDTSFFETIKTLANHGQSKKYYHDMIGFNSRLDTLQATVLNVKLKYLNEYIAARRRAALVYDDFFSKKNYCKIPTMSTHSTHVYHQYVLKIFNHRRDQLKTHLDAFNIPSMIYYPVPLHHQKAFENCGIKPHSLKVAEKLCDEVLALPMHTELNPEQTKYICDAVNLFFDP